MMWRDDEGRARRPLLLAPAVLALAALMAMQDPVDLQVLRNRAQARFEEKQTAAAAEVFRQVAAAPDATAADWNNLALALYELSGPEPEDAEILEALERSAQLRPGGAAAHYLRGLVHKRRGRHADAAAEFAAAAALDDTDAGTLYNWAASLHDMDRVDDALDVYERVIGMGFDVGQQFFVSSLYRSGRALALRDGVDAARPLIERYQQYQRRLSQAQRAPTALEAGRYKAIVVPTMNLTAATPDTAARLQFEAGAEIAAPGAPGVAVGDTAAGAEIFVHDPELAERSGTVRPLGSAGAFGVGAARGPLALGDFDRDGRDDLFVAAAEPLLLRRLEGETPAFEPVETDGIPALDHAVSATWVDADHDGDLDLLVATDEPDRGVRWFANHGGGEFMELSESAGLGGAPARQVIWADFDDDNDIDLLAVNADGGLRLFTNVRELRFEEIGAAVGVRLEQIVGAHAADFDNDGWLDVAAVGGGGLVVLANNGDGTFRAVEIASEAGAAVHAGDLNNDGWLDLVTDTGRIAINAGALSFEALPGPTGAIVGLHDHGADGALDVLARGDDGLRWLVQPAPLAGWLRVGLAGVKNNLRGVASSVEVKAGGLYQHRLARGRWQHVGLGDAAQADVVRITWPNGIIQNETEVAAATTLGPITEVERLEGSCPLLYTWDGREWRFINEVLGVAPLGMPLATGVIHPADHDEYVPIPGEALRERDGYLEVRLTEELRETGYLDALRLIAVDHPGDTVVVPDERFVPPPHPEFSLFSVSQPRAVEAVDQDGRNWTTALREVDGDWTRPFETDRYEGLAEPHTLELRLPEAARADTVRLFLTGWVYWATGSINLQVDQDPRVAFTPVTLEVPDGRGGWRVAVEDIGLPNAKNSTLVVELDGHLDPADPRVRLSTTMRLYWDAAYYTTGDGALRLRPRGDWAEAWGVPRPGPMALEAAAPARLHVLEPAQAAIRWRGFSRLVRGADGFETFDYRTVAASSNWNQHRGSYTRYGSVDGLLQRADDELVIVGTGDEVAVRFAADLPALPDGWRRDWLLYLNGWVKDGDPNTLGSDRVEPLPYHGMELYPADALARETEPGDWQRHYNTRPARAVNSPLRPRR